MKISFDSYFFRIINLLSITVRSCPVFAVHSEKMNCDKLRLLLAKSDAIFYQ